MYWCWAWWTYKLPVVSLIGVSEIWCRAWDESNNGQPNNVTWNLMGMGNNQCFRVRVNTTVDDAGDHVFKFEHPTQPGQETGGWMTKVAGKPKSAGFGNLLAIQGDAAPAAAPKQKPA